MAGYHEVNSLHHLCAGSWDQIIEYDDNLITYSCKRGLIQDTTGAIWANATMKIEQGRINEVKRLIDKLKDVWEDYENLSAKIAIDTLEVGRHLIEPESRYKEFNGLKAEQYLEKAKAMFQEMDLLWDIDELAKLN